MKAVRNLISLIVVFAVLGVCLTGFLHNIYLVAANDVTLMSFIRAVGIILFPLGIILGLI